MIAQSVKQIVKSGARGPNFSKDAFLREVYPKLLNYYQWLFQARAGKDEAHLRLFRPASLGWISRAATTLGVGQPNATRRLSLAIRCGHLQLGNKLRGYDSRGR